MILTNYHTHSQYCDGNCFPEDYVRSAVNLGYKALGFSSHAPVPFENAWSIRYEKVQDYLNNINALKKKYSDKIEIYLGFEIDYIPGITDAFKYCRKNYNLDYVIGGVHLVKKEDSDKLWFIDGSPEGYDEGLKDIFEMNIRQAVQYYFSQLWDMITIQKPDIIAHFDKIKMNNRNLYFSTSESWYKELINKTIKIISNSGKIVEVNTRGIYTGRCSELFPSVDILKRLYELKVPVTISTDAHSPEQLHLGRKEAFSILKDIGFRTVKILLSGKWQEQLI